LSEIYGWFTDARVAGVGVHQLPFVHDVYGCAVELFGSGDSICSCYWLSLRWQWSWCEVDHSLASCVLIGVSFGDSRIGACSFWKHWRITPAW